MIKFTMFYKIQSRAARDESPFYGVDFRKKEVSGREKKALKSGSFEAQK